MINYNNKPPLWENEGTEPLPEEITAGYEVGDKVPAPYLNYHLHQTGKCIEELQTKLNNESLERESEDHNHEAWIRDVELNCDANLDKHKADTNNPHHVTKEQVGLDKVDNTPDSEKSVAFASEAGVGRKVQHPIEIHLDGGRTEGTDQFTFDGSTNRSVNITPDKIGGAKKDLSNVDDEVFKAKIESFGAVGVPIVNGTTTDGSAYTATVDGLNIENGSLIVFIPNSDGASDCITLDVNGTGAAPIYLSDSEDTGNKFTPHQISWLKGKQGVLLMYDKTTNSTNVTSRCWKTVAASTKGEDIRGVVSIAQGGTGAHVAEQARENLGAAEKSFVGTLQAFKTDWVLENGMYKQTISYFALKYTDTPILDVITYDNLDENKLFIEAWSHIIRAVANDGNIVLYADSIPDINFLFNVKVVR